ncbi:MAG: hypothetical protein ABEH77_07015 [Halobacteriaceae archaeon]
MSNSSAHDPRQASPLRSGWLTARRAARAAAFWSAVVLPFLYLPLVVAGPRSATEWLAVGVLVAVHAVALVVGHTHHQ